MKRIGIFAVVSIVLFLVLPASGSDLVQKCDRATTSCDSFSDFTDSVVYQYNSNIGIGVSSPVTKLEVSNLMRVSGSTWPGSGEGLEIGYDTSLNKGYIQAYDRGTSSWGKLYLGDGNVGIGVTDPSYKLHVVGTSYFYGNMQVDGHITTQYIQDTNNTVRYQAGAGGSTTLNDEGGSHRLIISNDGTSLITLNNVLGNRVMELGSNVGAAGYEAFVDGDFYAGNAVSAAIYYDRTPYPPDVATAYAAVLSMHRLPDGQYNADDISKQLDHSSLHAFLKGPDPEVPERSLSATVSAQNEVMKDLIARIDNLESRLQQCSCSSTPE